MLFRDGEAQPLGERNRSVGVLTTSNQADLRRLEELLETISV
jgi:hypothetical protein